MDVNDHMRTIQFHHDFLDAANNGYVHNPVLSSTMTYHWLCT